MSLVDLKPTSLWQQFSNICAIPHPSKHEQQLVDYILKHAAEHGIEAETDTVGNVKLTKPATAGYEQSEGIIMQSHIDMVPQKLASVEHDFLKDPIAAYVAGDWVTAKGTTLGADNGIGAAAILAVMFAKDIQHGPLEALLTVDEEVGMSGAFELKEDWFKGKLLINLDTEEEGELYVGCAGGVDVIVQWPVSFQNVESSGALAFELNLNGLKGGHSGIDIHKGRANANKLLNRVLLTLVRGMDLSVSNFEGGSLINAIPREATATVVMAESDQTRFNQLLADEIDDIRDEYDFMESDLVIEIKPIDTPEKVFDMSAFEGLLNAIMACPNGVMRNSDRFEGVVETSSNLGIITTKGDQVELQFMPRSLKDHARDNAVQRIKSCFELIGAEVECSGAYPGWPPAQDTSLLETMKDIYQKLFKQVPGTEIIHAGLECGILGAKYTEWNMISFGPTITGAHTPDEQVHIGSVERFWDFLLATLKALAEESK